MACCQVSWINWHLFWDLLGNRCWTLVMRFPCYLQRKEIRLQQELFRVLQIVAEGLVLRKEWTEGDITQTFYILRRCLCSKNFYRKQIFTQEKLLEKNFFFQILKNLGYIQLSTPDASPCAFPSYYFTNLLKVWEYHSWGFHGLTSACVKYFFFFFHV